MQLKTQAIVLNSYRYKEADLIVKLLTLENGVASFLVKNVLKSKRGKINSAFFQLGNFLQIDYNHKANKNFQFLTEVKLQRHYNTLQKNISKISIITFLCEILNYVLLNEEDDIELFSFVKNSLFFLEESSSFSLFHHSFLLQLTYFLGCFPSVLNEDVFAFDLVTGNTGVVESKYSIHSERLNNFKLILGTNFDELNGIKISKEYKKILLNDILDYYHFHVTGYKKPKSLAVLEQVFN